MTVDGGLWEGSDGSGSGTWNQSQEWSDSLTAGSGGDPAAANAFDADLSTRAQSANGPNQTLTFAPSSGVSFTSTLEVYCDQGDETPTASWDGNSVNPGGGAWVTVFTGSGTINAIYPLVINTQGATQYATLKGVRLDGRILVDPSFTGGPVGETVVTGPAKSGTGTFVSTNGIDSMFVDNSNDEWISNDNRLGEEFFIKKLFTALNANDPAHVAMQQAVTAAFAAFPTNVNARRTSIASSFYRLMAGETLSAEESAALTATVRTAVNVVEPFALDGYYPLYYTAEAANAASSIGDHHTHDMEGDTFYMPDGGAIYHGTYLVPEEEAVAPTPAPTPTPTPTTDPTPDPGSGY